MAKQRKKRARAHAAPKKHRRAKRRHGLTLAKSGTRRRTHRRSGFSVDSWKTALVASAILRALSGLVFYMGRNQAAQAKTAKEAEATADLYKKLKIIVPAGVAIAAGRGMIPVQGLFPVAVDQTFNATVENFDFLKKIFDFRFLDKDPQPKPGLTYGALTPRSLAETRERLARSGSYNPRVYETAGVYRRGLSIGNDMQNRTGMANGYRR